MPTQKQKYIFTKASPQRLDVFLQALLPDLSRNYVQMLIAEEKVRVNGAKVKKSSLVSLGNEIAVDSFCLPHERKILAKDCALLRQVYANAEFVVFDKPSGLPTHPNVFEDENTVANALVARFPQAYEVGEDALRPGIVHRLDTYSSGLLVCALTKSAYAQFRELFSKHLMIKIYVALVLGKTSETGRIGLPVAHHPRNPRKMVALTSEKIKYRSTPRQATTLFRTLAYSHEVSLLQIRTLTGRMHQVRVHMQGLGHPLVGDVLYQTSKQGQADKSKLQRHFLHAQHLAWSCAKSGEKYSFSSNLPNELKAILEHWSLAEPDFVADPFQLQWEV